MPESSAGRPLLYSKSDHEAFAAAVADALGPHVQVDEFNLASTLLDFLAAAGRLLPPDAEHREEWTYRAEINGHGQRGEDGAEVFDTHEEVVDFVTSWSRTYPSMSVTNVQYVTRTVFAGSWVEVDPDEH